MKKKATALFMISAMAIGLCGCGYHAGPTVPGLKEYRRQYMSSDAASKEKVRVRTGKETAKNKENSRPDSASDVTLGSDQALGYTGFQYLVEHRVSISDTKSGNRQTYSVFVPDGNYAIAYGSSASGISMGVDFTITIDPFFYYNAKDYTLKENLEYYVQDEWEYLININYDISIGDIQMTDNNMAVCEVSYISYDQYDGEYSPIYVLYCVQELENGVPALAQIVIDYEETTGKTKEMLAELSSFYGFEIDWDTSFARAKMEEFEANGGHNPYAFNLGYMSFELPEGWEKSAADKYNSIHIFAPGGDMLSSDVVLIVTSDFSTEDVVDAMLYEEEATKALAETLYGGISEINDVSISDFGDTFMGHTVEIYVEATEDGSRELAFIYVGQQGHDVFEIYLLAFDNAAEEDIAAGQAALDRLFETGELK